MIYVIQRESSIEIFAGKGRGKGNSAFERYQVLDCSELPNVLSKIKGKKVAVLGKFPSFSSDLITIPKLKEGLAEKVISKEVKSRFSNIKSPILIHKKVSEMTREGVTSSQIFIAAIEAEETDEILTAIVSSNKECAYISLFPLVLSQLLKGYLEIENCFVACDVPNEKVLMLFSPKDLALIRVMPSETEGFSPLDYENINQTITFCRESLRIFPSKVLFVTRAKDTVDINNTIIPAEIITLGTEGEVSEGDFIIKLVLEFLNTHSIELAWANFLPVSYVSTTRKLKVYTAMFVVACLLAVGVSFNVLSNAIKAKDNIYQISILEKKVQSILPTFEEYKNTKEIFGKILPLINFHNQTVSAKEVYPSIESVLNFFDSRYKIDTVDGKREGAGVTVRIAGKVVSTALGSLVADFDNLVMELGKKEGFKVLQSGLDIKSKSFNITVQVSI